MMGEGRSGKAAWGRRGEREGKGERPKGKSERARIKRKERAEKKRYYT